MKATQESSSSPSPWRLPALFAFSFVAGLALAVFAEHNPWLDALGLLLMCPGALWLIERLAAAWRTPTRGRTPKDARNRRPDRN